MALEVNRIIRADCVAGLRRLPEGSAHLAFADPPFNIGYKYDVYDDRKKAEEYLAWTREWIAGVVRVLRKDGAFWLAIGDEFAAEAKLIAQRELGLTCRSWVIWYYTFGVHCQKKFTRSHAHLLHFVKDPERFTFNDHEIRVPSARQLVYADRRADPKGRVPDDTWILRPQDVPDGFHADHDTWYFPRVCGTFAERAGWHGCQMPEQLLGRIIRACSNPGDLVLDPFGGSGTTYAVAKKLGRNWIGFEVSAAYAMQIRRRLKAVQVGEPLVGSESPLTSAPPTSKGKRRKDVAVDVSAAAVPESPPPATAPKRRGRPRKAETRSKEPSTNGDWITAITEAFARTSDGLSTDRLITDPALSEAFCDACRKLGIPGGPKLWLHRLLTLRKAGKLRAPSRRRRVEMDRERLELFSYASEIAWRILSDKYGLALDEIFCDPEVAAEFDRTAAQFEPGRSPLEYRWAALYLRKSAFLRRKWADLLPAALRKRRLSRSVPLDGIDRVLDAPGVYLLSREQEHLYLGESGALRSRLERHQQHVAELLGALGIAETRPASVQVLYLTLDRTADDGATEPATMRCGLQSWLLGRYATRANHPELAAGFASRKVSA